MINFKTIMLISLAFLFGCLCLAAQTKEAKASSDAKPNGHLKSKYDKSKDVTTVSLKTMALSSSMTKESTNVREVPQLDLDVYFTHSGQTKAGQAKSLIFRFRSRAKSPAFQEGQNVLVVVNDETALQMGKTGYTSHSETFYIDEFLTIDFPDQALSRISEAKSLKLYLGPREIKISNDQLEDFKAIISAMRS
jgi:hypothetical protein